MSMGQLKSAPWQMLAVYKPSALVFFTTTLITLDFYQEVPYANHITTIMPHPIFHVPLQVVGHVEYHFFYPFKEG